MVRGQRFRFKTPAFGMHLNDGSRVPVPIPANAVVEVANGLVDGDKLIDVYWDGKLLSMFTQDIHSRADEVKQEPA